jgi:hypothetical protein
MIKFYVGDEIVINKQSEKAFLEKVEKQRRKVLLEVKKKRSAWKKVNIKNPLPHK